MSGIFTETRTSDFGLRQDRLMNEEGNMATYFICKSRHGYYEIYRVHDLTGSMGILLGSVKEASNTSGTPTLSAFLPDIRVKLC